MPICNTNEFLVKRFFNNKVMCLDIGEKRWGVALSNPNNSFSLPLKVLDYDYKIINSLNQIIEDYNIDLIINHSETSYVEPNKPFLPLF